MKVPATPPSSLELDPDQHLVTFQEPLWRIFRTEGPHALGWNQLRHFGPLPDMRFDPHPPPPANHSGSGVMYTATRSRTALAEVYQEERNIMRSAGGATFASWTPSRPLTLLDLTSNWPVRNGAAAAMMMDNKEHTQAWALAIDQAFGADIDGLYHQSSITNEPLVTLFSRTERIPAFPARPRFRALLSDSSADPIIDAAKEYLKTYESS